MPWARAYPSASPPRLRPARAPHLGLPHRLLEGGFRTPRKGKHDDNAHPPIHPVKLAQPHELDGNDKAVRH